jgi:hypothetical protein
MSDKPFSILTEPQTPNKNLIYLHLGAEQHLQNWWNFWCNSDLGGRLGSSSPRYALAYQDCHILHGQSKLNQFSTPYGTDSCGNRTVNIYTSIYIYIRQNYVRLHQLSSTVALKGVRNGIIYSTNADHEGPLRELIS